MTLNITTKHSFPFVRGLWLFAVLAGCVGCTVSSDGDGGGKLDPGTDTKVEGEDIGIGDETGEPASITGGSGGDTEVSTGKDTGLAGGSGLNDTDTAEERPEPWVPVALEAGEGRDGLIGWNIRNSPYLGFNLMDMLSFEWDYFMVHDGAGKFTGSIGYLLANPRNADLGGLGEFVPQGGNVAVAGKFGEEDYRADYLNFGARNYTASSSERSFNAEILFPPVDEDSDFSIDQELLSAQMIAVPKSEAEPAHLILKGKTESFEWELNVRQQWKGVSSSDSIFVPVHGADIGQVPVLSEEWNVYMLWPRTKVNGWITNRETGERVEIDGHGYRENSYGRWAFNNGGWDFAIISDEEAEVIWAWQSYHLKSETLDFLDVAFVDDAGLLQAATFNVPRGELGWSHDDWYYDEGARQCMPLETSVIARNDDYLVEAQVTLGYEQVPMLSDATAATKQYVIMIQFPFVEGKITRLIDGAEFMFAGQGGGEFSSKRRGVNAEIPSAEKCREWGKTFSYPKPSVDL